MLRKGHHGLQLDDEAMDRLVTWIDLNAPCHGTWSEVFPIPDKAHERRLELRRLYVGSTDDPEADTVLKPAVLQTTAAATIHPPRKWQVPYPEGWPLTPEQARKLQSAAPVRERSLDLGEGMTMKLVWIPPGQFVMGDPEGAGDEQPPAVVTIRRGFWMAAHEVTNEQFRRFDSAHDSRYYAKRHARNDDEGLTLNQPRQPAVRVAWTRAMEFCRWLSARTGSEVTLPTEAQWEYACRAGTATALYYGELDADFSAWANVGDLAFAGKPPLIGIFQMTGGLDHLVVEGASLADARFNDRAIVTSPVGSYRPNAWGLHDMHGNAAEWTLSDYRGYPYKDDGRNRAAPSGQKVVRGGSFFDAPKRCRSAHRLSYPAWQRVFNVGFRVVSETPDSLAKAE
jgi:formylglycine-generating enzyme required for sulfatase activity